MIVVEHISGHLSVTNTKTFEVLGITDSTPDPAGGVIERYKDGPYIGSRTGLFKEMAKFLYTDKFAKGL